MSYLTPTLSTARETPGLLVGSEQYTPTSATDISDCHVCVDVFPTLSFFC